MLVQHEALPAKWPRSGAPPLGCGVGGELESGEVTSYGAAGYKACQAQDREGPTQLLGQNR